MSELGQRLRELRIEHKLTQADIGKLLGVGKTSVSGYELGDRDPSSDALIKLSNYFGVSTDYLLGVSKERNNSEDLLAAHLDKDYKNLSADERDQIKNFIRFIKRQQDSSKD